MLQDRQKTSILYKAKKGFGDTRSDKEVFEEPYRSLRKIFKSSVLTFGSLIPTSNDNSLPITASAVRELDVGGVLTWNQSSFRTWDIIAKKTVTLTPVSPNANDAYVVLDENGKQIQNIIPFDYFEDVYNYTLRKASGEKIPYGVCDWELDIDSSILTFYNGVPDNVAAELPPTLTFFQYVGPTGDQTYLEGLFVDFDVSTDSFTTDVTAAIKETISKTIGGDWYNENLFNGSDITEGIATQFSKASPVQYAETLDPLNGYDKDSDRQVVSIISNIGAKDAPEGLTIKYADYRLKDQTLKDLVFEVGENIIYTEYGWLIAENNAGSVAKLEELKLIETEEAKAALFLKDGDKYKPYEPREAMKLTLKVPLIVDLVNLPPSLKLTAFNSFSDSITPQYYGPRSYSYVIANANTSTDILSADFIAYDDGVEGHTLQDALTDAEEKNLFFRDGMYLLSELNLNRDVILRAENNVTLNLGKIVIPEGVNVHFIGFTFGTQVAFEIEGNVIFSDCQINSPITFSSSIVLNNTKTLSSIIQKGGTLTAACNSAIYELAVTEGLFYITGSSITSLTVLSAEDGSIIDSTKIDFVAAKPKNVKLESSYVIKYDPSVSADEIPSVDSVVYYKAFNERVYANLPKTLRYNDEKNQFEVLVDSENLTIQINDKGELYCRPLDGSEIEFGATPKTQLKETYGIDEDTVLRDENGNKVKPETVAQAILDLYWSKASLVNGKLTIEQLPDSVAYGGLSFVGMWSFEKHNGEYPTFIDVDVSKMSDNEYSDLQRGWFFIVDSSTKEDDPTTPQVAIDGKVFTAGDWIVYEGKSKPVSVENLKSTPLHALAPVQKSAHTLLQYNELTKYTAVWSSGQQYGKNKKIGLSTLAFFEDHVDLYKSDETGFHFVESYPVEYVEGLFDKAVPDVEPYKSVIKIKIGDYSFKVNGTGVRKDKSAYDNLDTQYFFKEDFESGNTQYHPRLLLDALDTASADWANDVFSAVEGAFCLRPTMLSGWFGDSHCESEKPLDDFDLGYSQVVRGYGPSTMEMENVWAKLDRAYHEAAFSRLPALAPYVGVDKPWTWSEEGEGLLDLALVTISEAFKLVNIELLKRQAGYPNTIKNIELKIASNENVPFEYCSITGSSVSAPKIGYDIDGASPIVLETEHGDPEKSQLDQCFYVGKEFEMDSNIGEFEADVFNPYEKWHLGVIPSASDPKAATGKITINPSMDEDAFSKTYASPEVALNVLSGEVSTLRNQKSLSFYCGATKPNDFSWTFKRLYTLDEFDAEPVEKLNLPALRNAVKVFYGNEFIVENPDFIAEVIVKNAYKYGIVPGNYKEAYEVALIYDDGAEKAGTITNVSVIENEDPDSLYNDAKVSFSIPEIFGDMENYKGTIRIKIRSLAFGFESEWKDIYSCDNIRYLPFADFGPVEDRVMSGEALFPKVDIAGGFGTPITEEYLKVYNQGYELRFDEEDRAYKYDIIKYDDITYSNDLISPRASEEYEKNMKGIYTNSGVPVRFISFSVDFKRIKDISGFKINLDWMEGKAPTINDADGSLDGVVVEIAVDRDLMDANKIVPAYFVPEFSEGEGVCHPGKSSVSSRTVTFGRSVAQTSKLYVRVGISQELALKNVSISEIH